MSEKKSLLVDKSKMPLAMGLAFVAFTTQFGGGFASGAQIYQYFINYGIWCLILPLVTQGLYALFFWYGMRYAYKHKTYDYRSFSDSLYGKTRHVMSNLYEICYLIMIGTASGKLQGETRAFLHENLLQKRLNGGQRKMFEKKEFAIALMDALDRIMPEEIELREETVKKVNQTQKGILAMLI